MTTIAAEKSATKAEILAALAEGTGLTRHQVSEFFDHLHGLMVAQLKGEPGAFALPGLAKFRGVAKPATPERHGLHPITKQPTVFKAKPARKLVKATPLKALKDMVQ